MTTIDGLFEAHLIVTDLERALEFYDRLPGLERAHTIPERRVAFFWIGERGRAMLGIWEQSEAKPFHRAHTAFSVTLDGLLEAADSLHAQGIEALDFHDRPTRKPIVHAWMPAASIYFYDPDGNQLEYITMLNEPPRAGLTVVDYDAWRNPSKITTKSEVSREN